jgi:hypothetical protein
MGPLGVEIEPQNSILSGVSRAEYHGSGPIGEDDGNVPARVKRRLKVRSVRPLRRSISSTGLATEKWEAIHSWAAWIARSPWSLRPSKTI